MAFLNNNGLSTLWNNFMAKLNGKADKSELQNKAPAHIVSTDDIGEGADLAEGVLYIVYEE